MKKEEIKKEKTKSQEVKMMLNLPVRLHNRLRLLSAKTKPKKSMHYIIIKILETNL